MSDLDKALTAMESLPTAQEASNNPELITPEVQQTIADGMQAISKAVTGLIEWVQSLNDWFYQAYLDDGAKYGETNEGMRRWLEERSVESAAKAKVELAAQRERDREEMRALGREMARKMAERGMTREEWHNRMYGFS